MAKKEVKKPYSYFDTPDGEDIFKKLWVVLKPATAVAVGLATVDIICLSQPKGYLKTLGRYVYVGLPIIGLASTFVIATNVSTSIRKQDDKLNWFIGGAATGALFGAVRGSTVAGCNAALALGFVGLMKKHCVQNGYTILPTDIKIVKGTPWSSKFDWTLTKHRPGNWSTGEK